MNTLDLFDYTTPIQQEARTDSSEDSNSISSSNSSAVTVQPTLNEEVNQVMDQLGKFWGGFRKQSQTVFDTARKDFGQVVSQAQRELGKYATVSPSTSVSADNPASSSETTEKTPDAQSTSVESNDVASDAAPSSTYSSSLLSRLQGSLPPNLTPSALSSTLQRHLPQHLQQGLNLENATADFAQLRATLAENIQRVQHGTTIQQAEKLAEQYMQKGGALVKEAGEFLKDAVKIVPPEETDEGSSGVIWDGSDIWTMQGMSGPSNKGKGKEKETRLGVNVHRGSRRTELLLGKLRSDPDELRKDPASGDQSAAWHDWLTQEVESQGGFESDFWESKIAASLSEDDKVTLQSLMNQLVPSEISPETFWTRYFFRVHLIEQEEAKRRALLNSAKQEGDDDFTWEDDEEDDKHTTPTTSREVVSVQDSTETIGSENKSSEQPKVSASTTQSPRESDDSYDLVSSASASGNVSSTGGLDPKPKGNTDEDDSDWE